MKVYLAGSVPKGEREKETFFDWRREYKKKLSSVEGLKFVNPTDVSKYEWNPFLVFGGDCHYIKNSDLLIVYAEDTKKKLGVGTSQELLLAKYFKKPVIVVLPKGTPHRRSNLVFEGEMVEDWIHPFIFSTSDLIVEKLEDAIPWIEEYIDDRDSKRVKDISFIEEGIEKFKKANNKKN